MFVTDVYHNQSSMYSSLNRFRGSNFHMEHYVRVSVHFRFAAQGDKRKIHLFRAWIGVIVGNKVKRF